MREVTLAGILKTCSNPKARSILSTLTQFNSLSYTKLRKLTINSIPSRANFAYYMKNLHKAFLIRQSELNYGYKITPKGEKILIFLNSIDEKFIADDIIELCKISKEGHHNIIKICTTCGNIVQ